MCNDHDDDSRCLWLCLAKATAKEKVMRLLLKAGSRDAKYALQRIISLDLETAVQQRTDRPLPWFDSEGASESGRSGGV